MKRIGIIIALLFFLYSCQDKQKRMTVREVKSYEKTLEGVNKFLVRKDEETIRNHCKRRGWDMKMKDSGLWYGVLKSSELDSVKSGDLVEIKYQVALLDGTVLYDSDSLGTKAFWVGHGGVESGLEEGILLMRNHEKYRFIMPPHRAHGLLGDLNKIPARSIIVYYVEILDIRS